MHLAVTTKTCSNIPICPLHSNRKKYLFRESCVTHHPYQYQSKIHTFLSISLPRHCSRDSVSRYSIQFLIANTDRSYTISLLVQLINCNGFYTDDNEIRISLPKIKIRSDENHKMQIKWHQIAATNLLN